MAYALSRRKHQQQQQQLFYFLGHMNYARLRAPLDHPSMTEFRLALEPINAIARSTPGFVWSLDECTDELRHAVPVLRNDPLLMPQLSLWTDVQSLQHFAFKSGHAMYLKRKGEWFTPVLDPPFAVCWWRPAQDEHPPTLVEAFERCAHLKCHGPSDQAFNFTTAKKFPAPST